MKSKQLPGRRELLAGNIVPVLLSTAVMSATTYIYVYSSGTAILFFVFLSFVFSAVTFGVFEFFRGVGKGWLTTAAVTIYLIVCAAAGLRGIDSFVSFSQWFMDPSVFTSIHYDRTRAVMLLLGAVLVPCLYYFTRIRYRGVFVFLICMCPFCLFAKTFTAIPVIFPIAIMTLFFILMTNGTVSKGGGASAGTGGRRLATGAFVLAVTIVAAFMPKLEYAPYREMFDEFVTGVTIRAAQAAADFNSFNDSSADTTSNDDVTIVLYFRGDNPVLLKRQSFNWYDSSDRLWKYRLEDSDTGYSNWQKYTEFEDPTLLYEAAGYTGADVTYSDCVISPAAGTVRAVYTPQDMTYIGSYQSDVKVYRTENDEYFISSGDSEKVKAYRVNWADFTPEKEFIKLFTDELAESLAEKSSAVGSYLRSKEQAEKYYGKEFYKESLFEAYSSAGAHQRVKELAEQITAGCETDYEKAAAIEAFFLKGDYIYDKDFTSYSAAPDVFILNTKRGACAAYATAMTLMCRELGLTVRYCEGFWVQRSYQSGLWYVTTADSHSFVQVWTDGYGWTNFNPTSSVTDGGYVDPTFMIVGITAAVIAVIGIIILILRPTIREKRFVRRLAKARGAGQASLIYGRINRLTNAYISARVNTMTPAETAGKCSELFGYDISGFVDEYEGAVYGGLPDDGDRSAVYAGFMAAYKEKLKEDKRRRKKKK
ncbi:MAG: transglutaminase-like domain-containing protein [Ruminiclostridium sp.]|nr:transglutaminase-like domain-containing protein [Ruminiclostridium sp.]